MKLNRLTDEFHYFFTRFASSYAPRKIRHICTERVFTFFDDDHIIHVTPHFLRPACLRALLSVPIGTSTLSLPDTVTVPGLVR